MGEESHFQGEQQHHLTHKPQQQQGQTASWFEKWNQNKPTQIDEEQKGARKVGGLHKLNLKKQTQMVEIGDDEEQGLKNGEGFENWNQNKPTQIVEIGDDEKWGRKGENFEKCNQNKTTQMVEIGNDEKWERKGENFEKWKQDKTTQIVEIVDEEERSEIGEGFEKWNQNKTTQMVEIIDEEKEERKGEVFEKWKQNKVTQIVEIGNDEQVTRNSENFENWEQNKQTHIVEIGNDEKGSRKGENFEKWKQNKPTQMVEIAEKLNNGDLNCQIEAAREIRRVVRSCSSSSLANKTRSRFAAAGVIPPLVSMLSLGGEAVREAALLALLNLAVRNERNKVKIVTSGAIPPLVNLLNLPHPHTKLPELATAAILTLSAAPPNKPIIASSGAVPLLINILAYGTTQGKVDAVTALYNLATCPDHPVDPSVLESRAVLPLLTLLKECKKHSKLAEKTTALLEILSSSSEGQGSISGSSGGILTLVETVEDGSHTSMEHAVGALLTLCLSCRAKYRELILNEGAIPGLMRLTVEGTPKAQERAKVLLELLRDSPPENRLSASVLEEIVYDITSKVDVKAPEKARALLQDMIQRSMELSMDRIQSKLN